MVKTIQPMQNLQKHVSYQSQVHINKYVETCPCSSTRLIKFQTLIKQTVSDSNS